MELASATINQQSKRATQAMHAEDIGALCDSTRLLV